MEALAFQGFYIDITGGNFCLFVDNEVTIVPMTVKDLEHFEKYVDMSAAGAKLRKNPSNDEERKYAKLYNYFYYKQRSMRKNVGLECIPKMSLTC